MVAHGLCLAGCTSGAGKRAGNGQSPRCHHGISVAPLRAKVAPPLRPGVVRAGGGCRTKLSRRAASRRATGSVRRCSRRSATTCARPSPASRLRHVPALGGRAPVGRGSGGAPGRHRGRRGLPGPPVGNLLDVPRCRPARSPRSSARSASTRWSRRRSAAYRWRASELDIPPRTCPWARSKGHVGAGRRQRRGERGEVQPRRRARAGRSRHPRRARRGPCRRVVDRGPGVPDDVKDRICEPFQRHGDASRGAGVGLGLAVARGFTESMGGTLSTEDTPGGGLTMVLTLRAGQAFWSGERLGSSGAGERLRPGGSRCRRRWSGPEPRPSPRMPGAPLPPRAHYVHAPPWTAHPARPQTPRRSRSRAPRPRSPG